MALVACRECKKEVSDLASACPHCGAPAKAAVTATFPTSSKAKVGPGPVRLVVSALVLLGVLSFGAYRFMMSQEQRDLVNRIASDVGAPVTPWIDRAQAALRAQLSRLDEQQVIASSIMNITHPTGTNPVLDKYDVGAMGDTLVATLVVDWKGAILRSNYKTVVRWKCTKTQNLGIDIVSDDGPVGVAPSNLKQLSDWFQTQVYPVVLSNTD